ncbi:MAG: hypothetical protein ACLR23_18015 [Clostridia bacterium]
MTEQGTEKIQLEKHDIPALAHWRRRWCLFRALAAVAGFFVLLAYWVL